MGKLAMTSWGCVGMSSVLLGEQPHVDAQTIASARRLVPAQRGAAQNSGRQSDPRLAQIERLKTETTELRERLKRKDTELHTLKTFQSEALSRLAAQHDEITTLRRAMHTVLRTNVHPLSTTG